jgi:lauroyl/myristoyl acyltransferase
VSLFRQWKGCQAPIFPLTIRRTGLLSHEVRFWDEFVVWDEAGCSEQEFYQKNAERMNLKIEEMVRWNFDEYFWMHDRWKI